MDENDLISAGKYNRWIAQQEEEKAIKLKWAEDTILALRVELEREVAARKTAEEKLVELARRYDAQFRATRKDSDHECG